MSRAVSVLYFDCFSGAAGDMILGALIDAGVPLPAVKDALGSLAISPDTVWTERVVRAGISATKFSVRGEAEKVDEADAHEHHGGHHHHGGRHHHHHHEDDEDDSGGHSHRTLREIDALIDGSALSMAGKQRAQALFHEL